jgi:hypothetical protein
MFIIWFDVQISIVAEFVCCFKPLRMPVGMFDDREG